MGLIKRVQVSSLTLFILFAGITTLTSNASPVWPQAAGNHMGRHKEYPKTATNRITDSTGNYQYVVLRDGTAEIIEYLKEENAVKIPAVLDGHPVTVIGNAFSDKSCVTSIEIPDTVTDIGSSAFSCTGIKEITLSESILRIGANAFSKCDNLERIYIPRNVEKIEGNIVRYSNKLTEIEVDSHNADYTSVDGVLYNKDVTELLITPAGRNMTDFQIPESVMHIKSTAFQNCKSASFTELVIPDRVTTLESWAFAGCDNLKKVVMGENVIIIEDNAFAGCDSLFEVILNEKLKVIGDGAFLGCYDLAKINIPDNVIEIGKSAFYNCESLKDINIPKSVGKIGDHAIACSEDFVNNGRFVYVRYTRIAYVCITGYKDTAAHHYAKEYQVTFQDAESGRVIRYDLIPVPKGKIEKVTAGAKKIKLVYKTVPDATYQIAIKKAGAAGWKKYNRPKTSAVIKGLTSGKQYKAKVRALRKIDGKYYYGKWSSAKKIKVR